MLQHNFSRPHISNFMENVADFLHFRLSVSAIGNEYSGLDNGEPLRGQTLLF